jgi:hypothetical protein
MKNIISFIAVFILFVTILGNTVVDTSYQARKQEVRETVYTYVDIARQDGYFTNENRTNMLNELSVKANCDVSQIVTELTTTPKYRTNEYDTRELIKYKITVPMRRFVNQTVNVKIEGSQPSEKLD